VTLTSSIGDALGYIGGACSIYAFRSKTMIPLRVAATFACVFVLGFGISRGSVPTVVANTIMLALNGWRLVEMLRLIRDSEAAAASGPRPAGYEWLKPFMNRVDFAAGHVLFRKGDVGQEGFLIGEGEIDIPEHDASVRPGDLLGEMGLLTTGNIRTASAVCRTAVRAWRISYNDMKQLCLQNPEFALHMAGVIARRYQANLGRADKESKDREAQPV